MLAHSLSGLAIQLQGAVSSPRTGQHGPARRDRAVSRADQGGTGGRPAGRIGALRGDRLPTVDQLGALVEGSAATPGTAATVRIDGTPRPLPAEASLALFRGAQEALTNIARYAPARPPR